MNRSTRHACLVSVTLAASTFAAAITAAADDGPYYHLSVLPTLGGAESQAYGINDEGVVVGFARDASTHGQPVVWRHGRTERLPVPSAYLGGHALSVNSEGAVCGYLAANPNATEPFLWRHDHAVDLGAFAPWPTVLMNHIADNGVMVGQAWNADSSIARVVVLREGHYTDVSVPGYDFSFAFAMNRHGVVAGYASGANTTLVLQSQGYVHDAQHAATTLLTPLPGDGNTLGSYVTSEGRVYGYSFNDNTQSVVRFRHNGSAGETLRTEPAGEGIVVANDELVVETYAASAAPVIYVRGAWVDLGARVHNLGSFTLGDANAMNDRGDIVGWGLLPSGDTRGFLLARIDDRRR